MMSEVIWIVYLFGEIYIDWCDCIVSVVEVMNLLVDFVGLVIVYEDSDDCGVVILGEEDKFFWCDNKGVKINVICMWILFDCVDVVVVWFGEKYCQWNVVFDVGYVVVIGMLLIILCDDSLIYLMKEVDVVVLVICIELEQVVEIFVYVIDGFLKCQFCL